MKRESNIYGVCLNIINYLDKTKDEPTTKAKLANLRNSINKDLSYNIESLAFVFSMLPEDCLGTYKQLNYFEDTILTVLQLYSIYNQGKDESVVYRNDEFPYKSFGKSLSSLRQIPKDKNSNDSNAIDQRFNAMVTSADFEELKHHLRQMIKLLKSKSKETIDFASLAKDLYDFRFGDKGPVRIKWARDYYRYSAPKKGEKDE